MMNFCKKAKCPSSESLLGFHEGALSAKEMEKINKHLLVCEFCGSELELYQHFPQGEENISAAEIPMPLLELAEALLGNKHKDFRLLNKLLSENEGLFLKEA